jgi:hypothetical protein
MARTVMGRGTIPRRSAIRHVKQSLNVRVNIAMFRAE